MIKKLIPLKIKARLWIWYLSNFKRQQRFKSLLRGKEKIVFIFLAADYGNLGDIAITYAQHKYLQRVYPDHKVIEIPISMTLVGISQVKQIIRSKDIVTIVGGGNFGDTYPMIEEFRQLVIRHFPGNEIICFPQTIHFKDKAKLLRSARVYSKHPNLTIMAREQVSYKTIKRYFSNKTVLTPDIVLSLELHNTGKPREGVIFCLRNDKEKKISQKMEGRITALISENFKKTFYLDTHISRERLSLLERTRELFKIWDRFQSAELIVTDRLHGMIFAHITKTPAVVFPNNNHKIQSSYEWIKSNPSIKLITKDTDMDIESIVKDIIIQQNRGSKLHDLKYTFSSPQ